MCLLLYSVSKLPSPLSSALQTHRGQVMVVAFPLVYLLMFEVVDIKQIELSTNFRKDP